MDSLKSIFLLSITVLIYTQATCNTITVEETPALLFTSHDQSIKRMNLETLNVTSIPTGHNDMFGLAFDFHRGQVYWSVEKGENMGIYSSSLLDNSGVITVANASNGLVSIRGIAVDWITGNIYYADLGAKTIGVCSHSGSSCSVIARNLYMPAAIALHPQLGIMFWADGGQLVKAEMDGSCPVEIDRRSPLFSLTIDYATDRLYWADSWSSSITTSDLNAQDQRQILNMASTLNYPYRIDLSSTNDKVYWNNYHFGSGLHTIRNCNKSSCSDIQTLYNYDHSLSAADGVVVLSAERQPLTRQNHCAGSQCSHLCVLTKANFRCACAEGLQLDQDGRSCVHF